MADGWDKDLLRKRVVRGLGWCLCIALWTVALLTLFPVHVRQATMPKIIHFPAAKFLHVSAYAFLTVYLKWLRLERGRWFMLAFLSLHAFGSEFFQQFVPGRHPAFSDVLIDHLGIALGMALTWKCWLPQRSCRSSESARSSDRFRIAGTGAESSE